MRPLLPALTDPAKGSACRHRACFNYDVLREYVGRLASGPKECPLATCGARLQRTRDVERDSALQATVAQAPTDSTTVWLRGDEIRATPPAAPVAIGVHENTPRRRSRAVASSSVDGELAPKRRRSDRRRVIVL